MRGSFRLQRYSQARSQRSASVVFYLLAGHSDLLDTCIRRPAAVVSAARKGTLMTRDLAIVPPAASPRPSPAAEARHLHPAALPRWRAMLGTRWQEQLARVTELYGACHDARQAPADSSSGPYARQAAWRRASAALRRLVAGRLALDEIEAALDRLAAGRFGWCQRCGSAITAARLAEMPQARCCPACER
jgi:DnaK suppressor protein